MTLESKIKQTNRKSIKKTSQWTTFFLSDHREEPRPQLGPLTTGFMFWLKNEFAFF